MDRFAAGMVSPSLRAVYCVEGSAEFTFKRAKVTHSRRFLEVTVHPDHLAAALSREYSLLGICNFESNAYSRKRLVSEIDSADYLIAQSEFAASTYRARGVSITKLRVVPLGVDLLTFYARPKQRLASHDVVRLLYVGQLSVRKGVVRLIEALDRLRPGSVELTLIGRLDAELKPLFDTLVSRCRYRLRWIPGLARQELRSHYQHADLFVLPSICDSFGQVVLEAMACGKPVLVTNACGAPVVDGHDGWVVPAADTEALVDGLALAVGLGPSRLAEIGNNAAASAAQYSWLDFRARMINVFSKGIEPSAGIQTDS